MSSAAIGIDTLSRPKRKRHLHQSRLPVSVPVDQESNTSFNSMQKHQKILKTSNFEQGKMLVLSMLRNHIL